MKSIFKTMAFCLLVSLTFTACQKDVVNNIIQYPPHQQMEI